MTLRELLKKTFWSPKDLAKATGVSISTARKRIALIQDELKQKGYINLNNSIVPSKIIIERLNIDIEWLEKTGGLDVVLGATDLKD